MTRSSIIQRKSLGGLAPPFAHGQLAYVDRNPRVRGYRNLDGGQTQNEIITIGTYSDGSVVTVEITDEQGEVYSFTYTMTTADADTAGVATSLAPLVNKHPAFRRILTAEASGSTVVLTGKYIGVTYTIAVSATGSGAVSTATDQAAADAGSISYGSVIMRDGSTSNNEPKGKVIDLTGLTEQVAVFTHGETANAQLVIEFEGTIYEAEGADAATIEAALDAALPTGLTASVSSADVTITVDNAGDTFRVISVTGDITVKSHTTGDNIDEHIAGISCYSDMTVDNQGVAGQDKVGVCEDGEVALTLAGATLADKLYIGTTGAEKGNVYRARAAGRVYTRRLKVVEVASNNFAVIDVLARGAA